MRDAISYFCLLATFWLAILQSDPTRNMRGQDPNDAFRRMDFYFNNASDVHEICSFDFFFEGLTDRNQQIKEGTFVSHHIIRSQPKETRVDFVAPGEGTFEMTSFLDVPGYQITTTATEYPITPTTKFDFKEVDIGKGEKPTSPWGPRLNWYPCFVPLCDEGEFPMHVNKAAKLVYDYDAVELKENEDGTATAIFILKNGKYGHEVLFSKEPDFLPISIKARCADLSPKGPKVASTAEDFRKWRVHSETRTDWLKVDKVYVPQVIEIEADYNSRSSYKRFYFSNWKFGKDVSLQALSRSSMAIEKVREINPQELFVRIDRAFTSYISNKKKK